MRAITVRPGEANSGKLEQIEQVHQGSVLVKTHAIGICGTDIEILAGKYGWPVPGGNWLVLGHESLGRIIEAPTECGLNPGDFVVGIVRRPDPVPCANCAKGEWDMCRNGQYSEHGIKQLHGFAMEQYRSAPERLVKVDSKLGQLGVLLEPASVVAKAWEHIERIGQRALWKPSRVLVTGAGPIGLLAALMGRQRGLEVDVLDRVTSGPKPDLVRDLGATYYSSSVADLPQPPDIVLECTGVGQLIVDSISALAPGGIVCLTGVSSGGRKLEVDLGMLNRSLVLENEVVFGSVNANRRHYEQGAEALAKADTRWLGRLISRRVPVDSWQEALHRRDDDVKVTLDFTA